MGLHPAQQVVGPPAPVADTPWSRKIALIGAVAFFLSAIVLLLIARFNGVDANVLPFIQKAVEPSLYLHDFYIRHSVIAHSSVLLDWARLAHIDLSAPAWVVCNYLFFTIISGWAVGLILRDIFRIEDRYTILLLLTVLVFADAKLFAYNKSSWIDEHLFSFAAAATSLRFWALYFLVRGNFAACGLVVIVIMAVSVKVGWFIWLAATLVMLSERQHRPLPWGLMLAALVSPAWALLTSQAGAQPPGTVGALFDILRSLHPLEDNPFRTALPSWLLFSASLPCVWWRLDRCFARPEAARIRAIVLLSVVVFLVGGFYLTVFYRVIPIPMVILLSPTRAMEIYAFLAYAIAAVSVLSAKSLDGITKTGLLIALCLLKVTPGREIWVLAAAAVALMACACHLATMRWHGLSRRIGNLQCSLALSVFCFLAGIVLAGNLSHLRTQYAYRGEFGFVPSDIDPDTWKFLRANHNIVAARPVAIIARYRGDVAVEPSWNLYAKLSGVYADPYYLPSLALVEEQQRRNVTVDSIVTAIGQSRAVSDSLRQQIMGYHAAVLVPESLSWAFPRWKICSQGYGWVELLPDESVRSGAPSACFVHPSRHEVAL